MPTAHGRRVRSIRGKFIFAATVSATMREAVETLFFFNPRQPLLHHAITTTVARTGVPRLFERDGMVWIDVPERAMQCLFIIDGSRKPPNPVAVALYERPTLDILAISHLAVDPAYALRGNRRSAGPGLLLIKKIMEIACCIKGVTRVQVPYRDGCFLRLGSLH